jgi:transcription-repair coupling factor (superfamily II helicase)
MKENGITKLYSDHPALNDLLAVIDSDKPGRRCCVVGLTGSAKSIILSHLFQNTQLIHVVIIPEKEEAAYFYNDLVSLSGDETIFFFPSTYKRSVQYEQTEPANIVLRTEVLNHLASEKRCNCHLP